MKEEPRVQLQPLFGLSPEQYLAYGAFLLIFIIVFSLLLLPGLLHRGTYYTVISDGAPASVFVDDQYRGATPDEIFIGAGTHNVRLIRPGVFNYSFELEVGGRLFLSLFIPRREELLITSEAYLSEDAAASLAGDISGEIFSSAVRDFASWSHVNAHSDSQVPELTDGIPVPPVLDWLALDTLGVSSKDSTETVSASGALVSAGGELAAAAGSSKQTADVLRGSSRDASGAYLPNSLGLTRMLSALLEAGQNGNLISAGDVAAYSFDSRLTSGTSIGNPWRVSPDNRTLDVSGRSMIFRAMENEELDINLYISSAPVTVGDFTRFYRESGMENAAESYSPYMSLFADPMGNPLFSWDETSDRLLTGASPAVVFSYIQWLNANSSDYSFRLPTPSEISALWANSVVKYAPAFTSYYTGGEPTAGMDSAVFAIGNDYDYFDVMVKSDDESRNFVSLDQAPIRIEYPEETGLLTARMVSPDALIYLIAEAVSQ